MLDIKLGDYDEQIKKLTNKYDQIYDQEIKPIVEEIDRLIDEKNYIIFKKELYGKFPLEPKYREQEVHYIEFMCADGSTHTLLDDDELYIDSNGYPYYSDYDNGIYRYDKEENKIIHMRYCIMDDPQFIGYISIKFKDKNI